MGDRNYHGLLFRLDGSYKWLLWYSDEMDGLYLEDGQFPSFGSAESLSDYARERGLDVDTLEATVHDIDSVVQWLSRPSARAIDSGQLLAAWNLATDVATSLGLSLDDRDAVADRAYERLFRRGGPQWASQPVGTKVPANWSSEEIERIAQVLERGLALLRSHLIARG